LDQYLDDYHVQVPKLKIKKDWAKGLDPNFADNYATLSMFDRSSKHRNSGDSKNAEKTSTKAKLDELFFKDVKQDTYPNLMSKSRDALKEPSSRRRLDESNPDAEKYPHLAHLMNGQKVGSTGHGKSDAMKKEINVLETERDKYENYILFVYVIILNNKLCFFEIFYVKVEGECKHECSPRLPSQRCQLSLSPCGTGRDHRSAEQRSQRIRRSSPRAS
jgi:hypothetical protein